MLKRMSVALAACMLIAAVTTSALFAAGPGKKPGGRQGMAVHRMTVDRFATALNLTQAQKEQVGSIITNVRTEAKAIVATDRTREDKRAAVMQLRSVAKENIAATLTVEQREKADSRRMIDKLLTPRAARGHKIMAKLDLSPEQKTQIQAVMTDTAAHMKALRDDTSLTPEAKKARVQEIRKASKDSISALLTPEQREKFLQWSQNKPGGMRGAGTCPMGCNLAQSK